jgi:hypothetical protein
VVLQLTVVLTIEKEAPRPLLGTLLALPSDEC